MRATSMVGNWSVSEGMSMAAHSPPKVSIGLPVFNGEEYLREAVESVLAQSFADFELLISDNASTDATPEICREFADADRRVRYLRNESNLGASRNWNKVFEMATGKYFKWLAHDDILGRDLLAKTVHVLDSDRSVVLCYPGAARIDERGEVLGERHGKLMRGMSASPVERYREVMRAGTHGPALFGLMRKEVLELTKVYQPYPGSPHVMLSALALHGRFFELPEHLTSTRDHSGRYSGRTKSMREKLAWWDPALTGRLAFPGWRRLGDYLGSVSRSPLTRRQRILCYYMSFRWAMRNIGRLINDLTMNLNLRGRGPKRA